MHEETGKILVFSQSFDTGKLPQTALPMKVTRSASSGTDRRADTAPVFHSPWRRKPRRFG